MSWAFGRKDKLSAYFSGISRFIQRALFLPIMGSWLFVGCATTLSSDISVTGAPTGLTAIADDGKVTLSWDSFPGAQSYKIYWRNGSGQITASDQFFTSTTNSYVHSDAVNSNTYYYRVAALAGNSESPLSADEVSATPMSKLTAPQNLAAVAGDSTVTLTWDAVLNATSYNIYWSVAPGITSDTGYTISGVTSPYSHTSLTNGSTFYYRVSASNNGSEGPLSEEVSATPSAQGSGTGGGGSGTGGGGSGTGNCVSASAHSEGGWWTMTECGPVADTSTAYSFDLSGWPAPRQGTLSFKAKGIDMGQIAVDPSFVPLHVKLRGPTGGYSSFMVAITAGGNDTFMLGVRLDSCGSFCEQADHHSGAIDWNPSVTYKFDCSWVESSNASCSIYDDSGAKLLDLSVPTWGTLDGYDYIAVGNQAEFNYPSAAISSGVTVSEITLAVKE